MTGKALLAGLESASATELLESLYGKSGVTAARARYAALIAGLIDPQEFPPSDFPETAGEVRFFTAAGRTELAGNHTDHNRGKVLAASIQLDVVAAVAPRGDKRVLFRSSGFPDVSIDLTDLSLQKSEAGSTESLVRGIAHSFFERGVKVKGFTANAGSTVFAGSGLSSSAAVEVLFGKLFDNLYGGGKRSALEIAQIGQQAENDYFEKPSGLMDQAASASGGAVAIDFADVTAPAVQALPFNPEEAGYVLCVVNTRGSHVDLTSDYAAIPEEMRAVARFFGRSALCEITRDAVLSRAAELRKVTGDRALLRALHFFAENDRVDAMQRTLETLAAAADAKAQAMQRYLTLVNQSGDSSWELLQNSYPPHNTREQGISLALALTRDFLHGEGACRVHGGGFAGTIQAYIPQVHFAAYQERMDAVFGNAAVTALRIRSVGTAELVW
ncbi:MAG: galactokinase [Treponema sp.]|jgi:galactokinase|nr:galactokinase [Treponema sp.]